MLSYTTHSNSATKNKSYAIISGATSGIGKALSIQLSKNANLFVLAIGRNQDALNKLKKENSDKIEILQMDISNESERSKILKFFVENFSVKFLIHNAATIEPATLIKDIKLSDWRHHIRVNLEAPIFLTQLLLPHLKNGRILHISSKLAHEPCIGLGANCISKAALFMAYQCLRAELKSLDILIGSLRPGAVNTPMQEKVRSLSPQTFPALSQFQDLQKQNKLLSPEKVVQFIEWVLIKTSDDDFSSAEWNIYDTQHHSNWLNNKEKLQDSINLKIRN